MTDRPALDSLDAGPEPTPWCCDGNAEHCPLCDTASLPYPWICPGHPDTAENRQRVQAPAELTPWAQLEALAFNTILPVLRDRGEWLPRSTRRAVAQAALAVARPLIDELDQARAELQQRVEADSADAAAGSYAHRAERAEAALRRVQELIAEYPVAVGTHLLEEALDDDHGSGPSVREAAADDRRWWDSEKTGE